MKNIELTEMIFKSGIPINQLHATGLRGAISNRKIVAKRTEFHHHQDNHLVFSHPKIQYQVHEAQYRMIGAEEGSFLLQALPAIDHLKVYEQIYYFSTSKDTTVEQIGLSQQFFQYKIVTPWLALNQDNYREYRSLNNSDSKRNFLQKKMIGNMLSFSKSMKYEVVDEIKVTLHVYEYGKAYTNDINTGLIGFLGTMETNFKLPEIGWGLGKWASRGYGIMKFMED